MAWSENEHPRDKDGKFTDGSQENSADRIKRIQEKHFPHLTEEREGVIISGAKSGAINPETESGAEAARPLYEMVRKSTSDVGNIADTIRKLAPDLNITHEKIESVKKYLFVDSHDLSDGHHPFVPDLDIANSWMRLKNGAKSAQPHDVTMIRHEIYEMQLIEEGMTQAEAHEVAQKKYNYWKECIEYHGKAHKRKMRG